MKPLAHLTVELGSKLDVAELFPIVYDELLDVDVTREVGA